MVTNKKVILSTVLATVIAAGAVQAGESCVAAVRALVWWATTSNVPTLAPTYGAATMVKGAQSKGYRVDHSASGCSTSKPCVLIYPTYYGSGISTTYGHAAVLKSSTSPYYLTDSNGVCGGAGSYRVSCYKSVNMGVAFVIHPK